MRRFLVSIALVASSRARRRLRQQQEGDDYAHRHSGGYWRRQTGGGPPPVSAQPTVTASGLQIIDIKVGTGAEAQKGQTVSVDYTGWLADGTKFDSSLDRGQPLTFVLGGGQLIPGFDEGVVGMKVGGQRRLIIPPESSLRRSGPLTSDPW